jgi:hypothetical protein
LTACQSLNHAAFLINSQNVDVQPQAWNLNKTFDEFDNEECIGTSRQINIYDVIQSAAEAYRAMLTSTSARLHIA